MPIFISYSHENKEFVDKLARQLVAHNINIWLDRWELSIGDSILARIQEAVDGASALLVILSKASVGSEWCKNEINAGLLRELEEKQVLLMPVMLEECDVPVFVRGKLYADFRKSFDDGLRTILEGVAKVTNENLGRYKGPEYHTDWAIDWGDMSGLFSIRLTYVEQAQNQPYTVLTVVTILSSPRATEIYEEYSSNGKGAEGRFRIISKMNDFVESTEDLRPKLSDQFEKTSFATVGGEELGEEYQVHVSARRLGEDTGRDILVNTSNLIRQAYQHMRDVLKTEKKV